MQSQAKLGEMKMKNTGLSISLLLKVTGVAALLILTNIVGFPPEKAVAQYAELGMGSNEARICNKGTTDVQFAAVTHGGWGRNDWSVDGWGEIKTGRCWTSQRIVGRDGWYYFSFFVKNREKGWVNVSYTPGFNLGGNIQASDARFCIKPTTFYREGSLKKLAECPDGYFLASFSTYINAARSFERNNAVYTFTIKPADTDQGPSLQELTGDPPNQTQSQRGRDRAPPEAPVTTAGEAFRRGRQAAQRRQQEPKTLAWNGLSYCQMPFGLDPLALVERLSDPVLLEKRPDGSMRAPTTITLFGADTEKRISLSFEQTWNVADIAEFSVEENISGNDPGTHCGAVYLHCRNSMRCVIVKSADKPTGETTETSEAKVSVIVGSNYLDPVIAFVRDELKIAVSP